MKFRVTMYKHTHHLTRPQVEYHDAPDMSTVLARLVAEHRADQDGSLWMTSQPPIRDGDDAGYVSFASRVTSVEPHRSFIVLAVEPHLRVVS